MQCDSYLVTGTNSILHIIASSYYTCICTQPTIYIKTIPNSYVQEISSYIGIPTFSHDHDNHMKCDIKYES